ncbi:PEGA domain-containing protein [Methanoregula sp.]|uniref:PEGA domain-containing protein n=1 Tax=Methanoregula sp. TaxID=2052170 RepID=UPI002370475E|nr:PEGA domain-containing protein [Methanoregula sp.]MDD1685997.1 PEGA domain-containing protein [Methanoregula sp.]
MADITPHITRGLLLLICSAFLITIPAHAFTADSLDITVDKSGDATATFRFTLEGLIENAIPQSMLEEQLVKGLAGSSDPPQLISMDRSSASLLLKKFANVNDVPTGTEYLTSTMDFKKAEIALQSSAVSNVITADFSPAKVTITFPDNYARVFNNVDSLPSITHTIVDPEKAAAAAVSANTGSINISASPSEAEVWMDGVYIGNAPSTFDEITPGAHTLQFQKSGYAPVTKNVNVTAGRTLRISVVLAYTATTPEATQSPGFGGIPAGIALAGCALLWASRRH